jgi:hypothetical protein
MPPTCATRSRSSRRSLAQQAATGQPRMPTSRSAAPLWRLELMGGRPGCGLAGSVRWLSLVIVVARSRCRCGAAARSRPGPGGGTVWSCMKPGRGALPCWRCYGTWSKAGFAGAPRVAGSGFAADGREMLSYVPGASPQPYAWSEDAVTGVGCCCDSCTLRPRRSSRRLAPAGNRGSGGICLGRSPL